MPDLNDLACASIDRPSCLLGGLSAREFMRRHWQKKPLLVRQAWPGVRPPVSRPQLFQLAARPEVESRLIVRELGADGCRWALHHGPFARRSIPPLRQPGWTLLVQGLDLHADAAHHMLSRFRFVPQARLDDLMISYATDGGGVGPHFDSYDVFLLQVHGSRRWQIGRLRAPQLQEGAPLKILTNFVPEEEWVLEPGDMLYLPPRWAHDGTAQGECMTCSIGFRSPARDELAQELVGRLLDDEQRAERAVLYRDPDQSATTHTGAMPEGLRSFAREAVRDWLRTAASDPSLDIALGEWLTEPKPGVWFEADPGARASSIEQGVRLDKCTRMLYDEQRVFINGESWRAAGSDARLMRQLADTQCLSARQLRRASRGARELLQRWLDDGWLQAVPDE